MQIINFNTILFALLAILVAFGILFGENRVRIVSMGAVLGLFVLSQMPTGFFAEITQKGFFGVHPTSTQAQLMVLGLILALFGLGSMVGIHKSHNNGRSVILSIITVLFVVSFFVAMLPSADRSSLVTDYNLGAIIYSSRFYVLLALTVWLVITQFNSEKKDRRR